MRGSVVALLAASFGSAQAAELPSFCSAYPPAPAPGQWQSSRVFYSGGRLAYATDAAGNRIPDYSYAGYKYGEAAIPSVPEVLRLSPA